MIIYIDDDFKCHHDNQAGYIAVETDIFDGKCAAYIDGYRFIPDGESWTREDGVVFAGEMIAPWKEWSELDDAQRAYERQLVAEYEAALSEIEKALGV